VIHLAPPTPAGPDADRVAYSVGRSLTAADFARQDRYIDARLLDLAPAVPGVISGMGITPARFDATTAVPSLATLTIGVGTGIGTDGRVVRVTTPMQVQWADLVQAVTGGQALADGAYFLIARTATFDGLDGPAPDPSAGTTSDPLLDIRQDSFVAAWLSARIGALPASRTAAGLALALNTLVGGLTGASLATAVGSGVPLALVLVQNRQAILLSQAAGRLPDDPDALNAMLLAQVREAFAMALAETGAAPGTASWQVALRTRFRFLPGAGELPPGLLLSPEAATASCPFFPTGMAVYLETIRASQVPHVMRKALGRPLLDLTANTAQAVTLALAVPDAAWTQALLDIPRGDPVLAADLHLAYARARVDQVTQRKAWIALYGGVAATLAGQPQAIAFLLGADAAAQNLFFLLRGGTITPQDLLTAADTADTPATLLSWITARIASLAAVAGTAAPPPMPLPSADATAAAKLFGARGYQVIDAEPADANPATATHAPPTSDSLLAPLLSALPAGSGFAAWSTAIAASTPDAALLQPLIDAGIVDPNASAADRAAAIAALLALPSANDTTYIDSQPGALLTLALLQLFYAIFVQVARSYELALDSHSRLIALQRQHLDIMSTSVSALAGGIMPDGSGLSFARLIPFVTLTPTQQGTTATPTPATAAAAANTTPTTAVRTFTPLTLSSVLGNATVSNTVSSTRVSSSASTLGSLIGSTSLASRTVSTPVSTALGNILGQQTDVAQEVAQQIGVISQAPTFQYQPVQYATAAHITAGATLLKSAVEGVTNLRGIMQGAPFNIVPTATISASALSDEPSRYAGIVQTTSGLLQDIDQVQVNALQYERAYLQFRDRINALEARIAQMTDALADARDALRNAQAAAAKTAGDYAAAQQLVQEETARVTAAVAARHQALSAATGLFHIRELQTVTARAPLTPMPLTADSIGDLVPGCDSDHEGPPASLQPFLDLLLETPLSDWGPLREQWRYLPDQTGLQRLGAMRSARLANWTSPDSFGSGAAAGDLASLASTTRNTFDPVFAGTINIAASLAVTQQSAFAVLSLPDIVMLPVNILRQQAEALRARIESATGCLFEMLSATPPSARFAWASLARAGTLPALDFAQWAVPQSLGTAGATTVRRLGALVNWMAAQLHSDSSAASRTALGNLVTAAVIAAAYGDPDDTVTGTVSTGGGVPRPGIPIRVVLNRAAPIGTVLNLLDETQTVVGTLRVDDHDSGGTTVSVLTSQASTAPTSQWRVATPKGRAAWLPS
jgi:hypothetical protein